MPRIHRPFFLCLALALFLLPCGCDWVTQPSPSQSPEPAPVTEEPPAEEEPEPEPYAVKIPGGMTIETRFAPPEGFTRVAAEEGSFGEYLRVLPLKPDGDVIYLFDGTIKPDDRFDAVLKTELNKRDRMRNVHYLLRWRGEYLYASGRLEDIEFHFLSGFAFPFAKWAEGGRLSVNGNKVDWSAPAAEADDSPESLRNYLNELFLYSNAAAIKQDLLQAVRIEMGYVFPDMGGAAIADMAEDENGRVAILLIRGGDPEQEGYVVRNQHDAASSPWFIVPENGILQTPEGELSVGALFMFRK